VCNTQQKHTNLTQVAVVTWSAIGSWISFAAIWVTSDILSFKTSRLNSTMHRFQTWFHTRNFLSQNFKGNYHVQKTLPGIPVVNQTHPIKTSQSISHNMNFCIVFISLWGSTVQRPRVQILAEVFPFTTVQLFYLFTETDRQISTQ